MDGITNVTPPADVQSSCMPEDSADQQFASQVKKRRQRFEEEACASMVPLPLARSEPLQLGRPSVHAPLAHDGGLQQKIPTRARFPHPQNTLLAETEASSPPPHPSRTPAHPQPSLKTPHPTPTTIAEHLSSVRVPSQATSDAVSPTRDAAQHTVLPAVTLDTSLRTMSPPTKETGRPRVTKEHDAATQTVAMPPSSPATLAETLHTEPPPPPSRTPAHPQPSQQHSAPPITGTELTYRFSKWGREHTVQIQSPDNTQFTLRASGALVAQRLNQSLPQANAPSWSVLDVSDEAIAALPRDDQDHEADEEHA